ncbi:MAG: ABC transporter ATP-binding protein [Flavobacteriales bacterium]
MNALLRTEQLAIGYQVPLIPAFDLALPEGQLVALLGVNGIGKSTLLRTLAGLQRPLQGRALINDADLHRLSAAERARTVSVVLTERTAPPLMDVRSLVALGRQPWTDRFGALTASDRAHVEQALEQAGVQHLAGRALDACSDGERQKAFIARAIAQDTPLLLLDEPTAYLDLPNRSAIVRLLRSIARESRRLVLFSTHDIQLAVDLCDALLLLRPGMPPWSGSPADAVNGGLLEEAFTGSGLHFDRSTGTHRYMH